MDNKNVHNNRSLPPSRIKFQKEGITSAELQSRSYRPSIISSLSFNAPPSETLLETVDDSICYHNGCSFAYRPKSEMKRASFLQECLPQDIFERLAAILDLHPDGHVRVQGNKCRIPEVKEEEDAFVEYFIRSIQKEQGYLSNASEDMQLNADSEPSSVSKPGPAHASETEINPYLKFIKRVDDTKSEKKKRRHLGAKSGKITKKIIKDFLQWYKTLGESEGDVTIEESTLQELIQIGFDIPGAKAVAITVKELPTVPECLALLREEPKHSTRYVLREFLKADISMENKPMKMYAFGSMLPKERPYLRYKPPRNNVKFTWMECSRVPVDLDTMKTVWKGLERLRSTIAFSNWLKHHPEITPPAYLQQKGLLNINYEEWNIMYKGFELDADKTDNLEQSPSDHQSTSFQEPRYSQSLSMKDTELSFVIA